MTARGFSVEIILRAPSAVLFLGGDLESGDVHRQDYSSQEVDRGIGIWHKDHVAIWDLSVEVFTFICQFCR